MTTGRERQCSLRNLWTSQRRHRNWVKPFAWGSVFFVAVVAIMKYTQKRKTVSGTNSSGDVTEIKTVSSYSMRSWLFGHCISNTSYIALHLSPFPSWARYYSSVTLCSGSDNLLCFMQSLSIVLSLSLSLTHTKTHTHTNKPSISLWVISQCVFLNLSLISIIGITHWTRLASRLWVLWFFNTNTYIQYIDFLNTLLVHTFINKFVGLFELRIVGMFPSMTDSNDETDATDNVSLELAGVQVGWKIAGFGYVVGENSNH